MRKMMKQFNRQQQRYEQAMQKEGRKVADQIKQQLKQKKKQGVYNKVLQGAKSNEYKHEVEVLVMPEITERGTKLENMQQEE